MLLHRENEKNFQRVSHPPPPQIRTPRFKTARNTFGHENYKILQKKDPKLLRICNFKVISRLNILPKEPHQFSTSIQANKADRQRTIYG